MKTFDWHKDTIIAETLQQNSAPLQNIRWYRHGKSILAELTGHGRLNGYFLFDLGHIVER